MVVVGLTASPAGAAEWPSASGLLPGGEDARTGRRCPLGVDGPGAELDYWLGRSRSLGLGLDLSRIPPNISAKVVSTPTVLRERGRRG